MSLLRAMCRFQVRQEKRYEAAFRELHRDLMAPPNPPNDYGGLCNFVFAFLSPGACNVLFLEALLDANFFELAREVIDVEIERDEEDQEREAVGEAVKEGLPCKVASSLAECVGVVLKVAREYFDSASSCHEPMWQNAKSCLALIPLDGEEDEEEDGGEDVDAEHAHALQTKSQRDEVRRQWQSEVRREQKLMEAVQMLDELSLDPLPFEIRQVFVQLKVRLVCSRSRADTTTRAGKGPAQDHRTCTIRGAIHAAQA